MLSTLFLTFLLVPAFGDVLEYAVVLYRHGDRTPVDPYPLDPWRNESLWPVKFGQLTNLGKQQHFKLGQWLRKRYSNIISNQFDPAEIYVKSSDVDRTLMSAQVNLAGMYPPYGPSKWSDTLNWQPIPIHTVPEKDDNIIAMKKKCLAYNNELDRYVKSKPYLDRLKQYEPLMKYLTIHTGSEIKDYAHIEYIYNNLYIETLYNFTLPEWTQSVYPHKMIEPATFSFTIPTATVLLSRLKVGPLLKEITGHLVEATSVGSKRKLNIYSAHDDTVSAVLNALGLFNGQCPPYTATIFFELFSEEKTSGHFLRVSYRNSTELVEPMVLSIPHCGQDCPLDRFLKLYKNLIAVDWNKECNMEFTPIESLSHSHGMRFLETAINDKSSNDTVTGIKQVILI